METSGIKYMGSKKKLLPRIHQVAQEVLPPPAEAVIADVFTGSTRVAQFYRWLGYKTLTSDLAWASEGYAGAFLQNPTADRKMVSELLQHLNSLAPRNGWLTQSYGEVKPNNPKDPTKMVNAFTAANTRKADAIREEILKLQPELELWEHNTLLTSLIFAMDRVQNSQGHSRAFFREFLAPASQTPLVLELPLLVGEPGDDYKKKCPVGIHRTGNVLDDEYRTFLKKHAGKKQIVAYLDPPYTAAAQYDLFYHIWDSVYRWDKPEVVGATNMRADRLKRMGEMELDVEMKSDWCDKKKAQTAFVELFNHLDFVDTFLLSYSDESLLPIEDLQEAFEAAKLKMVGKADVSHTRHAMARVERVEQAKRDERGTRSTEWIFTLQR
jgi:adenine-specific DNA-methyltransferase